MKFDKLKKGQVLQHKKYTEHESYMIILQIDKEDGYLVFVDIYTYKQNDWVQCEKRKMTKLSWENPILGWTDTVPYKGKLGNIFELMFSKPLKYFYWKEP